MIVKPSSIILLSVSIIVCFIIGFWLFGKGDINALLQDRYIDIEEVKVKDIGRAWLVEDHSLPIISVKISFDGGTINDSLKKQGLVRLLSNTMDEGAGEYDAKAFQKALNDKSISLSFNSGRDHFYADLKFLSKYKDDAFSLLKKAMEEPLFEPEAIDRMRSANISRIKSAVADPNWLAARLYNDKAYEGHVYVLNSGGTISSLNRINRDDLMGMKSRIIRKGNIKLGVAGDISASELKNVMKDLFGNLPSANRMQKINDVDLANQGSVFLHPNDVAQTFIKMAWPGVNPDSEEYYVAQVLNHVLGASGFGSLLTEEIREKRGLTYGIYSYLNMLDHANHMVISTSTEHQNTPEMIDQINNVIDVIKAGNFGEQRVEDAKNYLTGALPLSLTSTSSIASVMLDMQLNNRPIDYLDHRNDKISAVTKKDIVKLANKIFKNAPMVVMVGTPDLPADIEPIIVKDIPNVE